MLGSVHIVDGGLRTTITSLRRQPIPAETPGLRDARCVVAAPLGGRLPSPQPTRVGLVAFWDGEAALDAFLIDHPRAEMLAGGWSARLEPLRAVPVATGPWPGIPDDLPAAPRLDRDGPVAVITIGLLRLPRAVAFLRASSRAERQVGDAPGLLWASGFVNVVQRVVATFSLWETSEQMRAYATSTTGHAQAMQEQRERSFHHVGSFIRFRPFAVTGSLSGRNPLPESVAGKLNAAPPMSPR